MERSATQKDITEKHQRLRKVGVLASAGVFAIVLLVILIAIKPAMPRRVLLLTGPRGSSYHDLGERYAQDLRRRGLDAEVVVTAGALDNLQRLAGSDAAVAFAPSTIAGQSAAELDTSRLVMLGSVGLEPLWVFYRSELGLARVPDLAGRTVACGGPGTTSYYLARTLIELNGLAETVELRPRANQTVAALIDGLTSGSLDAACMTGAASSDLIEEVLGTDGVSFLSFDRVQAYETRIAGVTTLTAPEGVFDLARNVPPRDAHLLATTICLVAHEDLHRAVVPMMLVAAENVHDQTASLPAAVTFPSSKDLTLPLAPAARRFFQQGETGLSKFLPYKLARFLNHLGFLVLPLLTVTLLLLKAVPAGLRIYAGFRVKGHLKQLVAVEMESAAGGDQAKLLAELDRIDQASAKMFVPRSVVHDYIDFRQFLHDMRARISE